MVKEKLKQYRKKKGFTQEQLAKHLATDTSNYSRKENGEVKITPDEWEKLASFLNCEIDDIYEENNTNVIYKNKGNSSVNNSGTIHYFNVPDFVLEHLELLKKENSRLQEEIKELKGKLNS
ncbi:helix-turn-helix transcriptional regulator [Flavobacterium jejuense]|uniref:Helix-turn-helix transcriptional regulator n=1 Tax=Flavobacterium jejuense TaxID=1544455 RepID=A0ABX0ILD8_9FLAO|nr:helix-turn-helix transcriptional regulator [Flavobacterium jejuense]NHN24617.1 helix-turn-helix transcriptional regulator [Flavobacterium jejuense]